MLIRSTLFPTITKAIMRALQFDAEENQTSTELQFRWYSAIEYLIWTHSAAYSDPPLQN